MPAKTYRPYTPSRRHMTSADFSDITRTSPEKSLVRGLRRTGGRNNTGTIMVRHQGGGHRRAYRLVDFKRDKFGVPGRVMSIEYDPNRSARICLVHYADGEKRYIVHAVGLRPGDSVMSGPAAEIRTGNALPLASIPDGSFVHCVELVPGHGAQMMRAAGSQAQLMAKDAGYATLRLPSGEIRKVLDRCLATLGQVSNIEHNTIQIGNAGRSRHRGIRPTVRGGAMNPVDHPLGGGRGKSKGGNHPRSPWGQPAKGYKTRRRKKTWGWLIVADRRKAKIAAS